jgi:hypothetical protein
MGTRATLPYHLKAHSNVLKTCKPPISAGLSNVKNGKYFLNRGMLHLSACRSLSMCKMLGIENDEV